MSDLVGNPEDRFSRVEALSDVTSFVYFSTIIIHFIFLSLNKYHDFLYVVLLFYIFYFLYEPHHAKTKFLSMRKQRRRSNVQ